MKKLIINLLFIVGIYITPSLGASIQSDPKPVKSSSVSWTAGKVTGTHSGIITLDKSYLEMDGDRLVGGRIVVNMNSIIVTDLEGKSKSNKKAIKGNPKYVQGKPTGNIRKWKGRKGWNGTSVEFGCVSVSSGWLSEAVQTLLGSVMGRLWAAQGMRG